MSSQWVDGLISECLSIIKSLKFKVNLIFNSVLVQAMINSIV